MFCVRFDIFAAKVCLRSLRVTGYSGWDCTGTVLVHNKSCINESVSSGSHQCTSQSILIYTVS